jgi:type IV pilus assembly protein PilW
MTKKLAVCPRRRWRYRPVCKKASTISLQDCGRKINREPRYYSRHRGLTLVELLVSLVIGLFLLIGVISLFTETRQSFRVNENFARIQENARFGFESLSREIREGGSTPCGTRQAMASVIQKTGVTPWYGNWAAGPVRGFDNTEPSNEMAIFGTSVGTRVSGTDAIVVLRNLSDESKIRVVTNHVVADNAFTVQANPATSYGQAELISVCDARSAAIVQVGTVSPSLSQIEYGLGSDNCSLNLIYAPGTACPAAPTPPATPKVFAPGSLITRYDPVFWYIANNSDSGRSLYRLNIVKETVSGISRSSLNRQEMIRGVKDMQIEYLTRNGLVAPPLATSFVPASDSVFSAANGAFTDSNPNQVVAVKVTLTFETAERVSTTGTPIERTFVSVSSIRSRDVSN